MENKKCSKYEGLFTFSDEETLAKHLEECEECRLENEKMKKVSELLSEVKMYYRARDKKKRTSFRAACAAVFLGISLFSAGIFVTNEDLTETLMYGDTLSAEELGFPVDSYGLIMVDE